MPNDYPHLSETFVAVSEHLSPTQALSYATEMNAVFLPMLQAQGSDPLGQAIATISPLLNQDAASRAAAALGASLRQLPLRPPLWQPLAEAQATICRRLPALDAAAHERRTVDWLIERFAERPENDYTFYPFRAADALLPLCGRLEADRAARVADTLLAILGDRERIGLIRSVFTSPKADFTGCAEVLAAAAERWTVPPTYGPPKS